MDHKQDAKFIEEVDLTKYDKIVVIDCTWNQVNQVCLTCFVMLLWHTPFSFLCVLPFFDFPSSVSLLPSLDIDALSYFPRF